MGQTDNAAIVRRAYEAFNTADMKTLNETFDKSAVWHAPGHSFGKDYQSRDATFAYFGQLGEGTGGTFRANLHHLLAGMTATWSGSSAAPETETASTWMSA